MTVSYLDFPFYVDGAGCAASCAEDDHVRDLIHQVLFTGPGERVNRPDLGCGLKALTFAPGGEALAAATQTLVRGSLQKWLADVIEVEEVEVTADEERLSVTVAYRRQGGERRVERFE